MKTLHNITIVILAGGQARRMGGQDKGLIPYQGKPLIEHTLDQLPYEPERVLISANRNLEEYAAYGEVIQDSLPNHAGPLAGILTAMQHSRSDYLLTLPCDSPRLPEDLVTRLRSGLESDEADIAVARCDDRNHYVIALLKTGLMADLQDYLAQGGRRVGEWQSRHKVVKVRFDDCREQFININTPQDLTASTD
ncbi:MAG: molybdenum cofactor guanylyltransferase [Gammaproteobacteria bacterium]|nr:molybdenum cofactor guanylyltransferase [Gammaproteobacteria bacterium]